MFAAISILLIAATKSKYIAGTGIGTCAELIVTSSYESSSLPKLDGIILKLDDSALHDGKPFWISDDKEYSIYFWGVEYRWTLEDTSRNTLFLADDRCSDCMEPVHYPDSTWTSLLDNQIFYDLTIECSGESFTTTGLLVGYSQMYTFQSNYPQCIIHSQM